MLKLQELLSKKIISTSKRKSQEKYHHHQVQGISNGTLNSRNFPIKTTRSNPIYCRRKQTYLPWKFSADREIFPGAYQYCALELLCL